MIFHPSETAAAAQRADDAADALKNMTTEAEEADDEDALAAEREHELDQSGTLDGQEETSPAAPSVMDRSAMLSLGVRDVDACLGHVAWCGVPNCGVLGCLCALGRQRALPSDADMNAFQITDGAAWREDWSLMKSEYAIQARPGDIVVSPSVGKVMNVALHGVYRAQKSVDPVVFEHCANRGTVHGGWVLEGGVRTGFDVYVPGTGAKKVVLLRGRMSSAHAGEQPNSVADARLEWSARDSSTTQDFSVRPDARVWTCTHYAALPQVSFVRDWRAASWLQLPMGARGLAPDPTIDVPPGATEGQYMHALREQRGEKLRDKNLQIMCLDWGEGSHVESAIADQQLRQTILGTGVLHVEFPIGAEIGTSGWLGLPCTEMFCRGLGANRNSVFKYYTSPHKKRERFVHSHGVVAYALALYVVDKWLAQLSAESRASLESRHADALPFTHNERSDSGMAFVRARASADDAQSLLRFLEGQDWSHRDNRQLWNICEFIYLRAQLVHLTMAQSAGAPTAHRAFLNRLKLVLYCSDAHPLKQRELTTIDCQQAQLPKFYDDIVTGGVELTTYRQDGNALLAFDKAHTGEAVGGMAGDTVHEVNIGITKSKDPRTARDVAMIAACMAMSAQDSALVAHESRQYLYHHKQTLNTPYFTSSVAATFQYIEKELDGFLEEQDEVPERCLRAPSIYGLMRAMHHLSLRKTGRKPPVVQKKHTADEWHSMWSVWKWQKLKADCKGYMGCQKRKCFDPRCKRGRLCPLSKTMMKAAEKATASTATAAAGVAAAPTGDQPGPSSQSTL